MDDPTSFCDSNAGSCYCDETCVSDFTGFCDKILPKTVEQSDFTVTIDSANADSPDTY